MDGNAIPPALMRQLALVCQAQDEYRYGDAAEGLRLIDVAIADGPQSAALWKLRGKCLGRLGRHVEAAESYGRGRALGGECSEDLVIWQAYALHSAGKVADAVKLLRACVSEPGTPSGVIAQAQEALAKFEAPA